MKTQIDAVRLKISTIACLMVLFAMSMSAFAGEPKPGDVINAGNIEQYKEYFPDCFTPLIKGTSGFKVRQVNIGVREAEPYFPPKSYMDMTEKNRGKLKIDPEGNIQGNLEAGMPFPDPKEPNLAQKIIWNFYYRWRSDQFYYNKPGFRVYSQRKGGKLTSNGMTQFYTYYTHRTSVGPKPRLPNSHDLFFSFIQHYFDPPNKDLNILVYRYEDPGKSDDMWAYIPTLRRALRMVSSERANPVSGLCATWDDYYGFDGKIQQFTYRLIHKKKCLALLHQEHFAKSPSDPYDHMIFDGDPWELWDHYMIEITPKSERYPESKRHLFLADNIFMATGAEVFDRNGELWRAQSNGYGRVKTCSGTETGPWMLVTSFIDFKTGFWNGVINNADAPPRADCPMDKDIQEVGFLGSALPFD
jgi:hypothetical protein